MPGKIIKSISLLLFLLIMSRTGYSQKIDILLKGGHVIDPANNIDAVMDVAISDGRIAKVAPDISATSAGRVLDVKGMYVVPGLIDIHTHVFVGPNQGFANGFSCVSPDDITFKSGITTVVDAGTSGWRNFPLFKSQVIDRSQTRILAFLSIAASGMTGFPSEENINEMDPRMTSLVVSQYPDEIVGVKIGHYTDADRAPFDRAIEAATLANVPLIVECHLPMYPLEEILGKMRPGDIYTHSFTTAVDRECILDDQLKLKPCVIQAKDKGVRFDVGHGGGMFHFNVAIPAFKQGLLPDSFGSDLHRSSMNSAMKNMLETMSKFLNIGMELQDVIYRATWNAAQSIRRNDLGNLSVGAEADVAVLSMRTGKFGFTDTRGNRLDGDRRLEAELTIRAGRIVYDNNGIAARNWLENQALYKFKK
ncbi:MAG: amidohydrolase/deacetylase family metallohydrolase [Bacteroidales bacterium]|jgi:dihydroorotase|nr:amidohydrolase/deacetylase family metallohydrolase [Bacteroidales bacterium]